MAWKTQYSKYVSSSKIDIDFTQFLSESQQGFFGRHSQLNLKLHPVCLKGQVSANFPRQAKVSCTQDTSEAEALRSQNQIIWEEAVFVAVHVNVQFSTGSAAAAKSLQLCPTLWYPIGSSPRGFPVPGILQARTLEWVAISFSNA